jgi:hypothetical protein
MKSGSKERKKEMPVQKNGVFGIRQRRITSELYEGKMFINGHQNVQETTKLV